MKFSRWFGLLMMLFVMSVSAAQLSCDPEDAAFGLFKQQGLTLLRPARDYIQPGGIVFVPRNGLPEYEEPKDVVAKNGNLVDFRGEILGEAKKHQTGLGAVLSLASSVIPVPINAGAHANQSVSLKQIDTTGVRLTANDLDELLAAPRTAKAALAELHRGTRVFIVQEVYRASSIDLTAEDGMAFDLHLNDGAAVPDCKDAKTANDSPKENGQRGTDEEKPASKDGAAKKSSDGITEKPADKAGKSATKANDASSGGAAGAPKLGAGFGVCVANIYTLKLQTESPIPFAVRLAELGLSEDGVGIRRLRGKIIKTSLGEDEVSGALINETKPVLEALTRRAVTKK